MSGWGASCNNEQIGGRWNDNEIEHINILELKVIYFALKTFLENKNSNHVQIYTDNTTAVAYINNMGVYNLRNVIKLLSKFGSSVYLKTFGYLLHTYQEQKM